MAASESPQPIALTPTNPRDHVPPRSGERHHVAGLPLLAVQAFASNVPSRPATTPGSLKDAADPAVVGSTVTRHRLDGAAPTDAPTASEPTSRATSRPTSPMRRSGSRVTGFPSGGSTSGRRRASTPQR